MRKSRTIEAGFTLLEMVLCLLFLSVFVLLVPRLHSLFIEKPYSKQMNSWEWDVFLEQVQLEFREVQVAKKGIMPNELEKMFFKISNDGTVTYEISGNDVVRKVNGAGREVLLQKVSTISYELTPYVLSIHVQDISGKVHRGVVTRYAAIKVLT
ncbi:competence type IV pilus minor pilin ComGF [Bacillus sp. DX1.1]|uniref:competence type IV pilus minor pilin ComGF n=1 Tax=unclassified Bacillus (in: firmicutes) TaxID=185979 RepID=UPI00257071BC|nr:MULTISPECIES: competence type IV pilus minor pilin ComGF [unclassified Bacillus (in: firmicutes)]MDM5156439.1 competence type IV pilus minor pilin ComGF [Bacillus sp. DX1.1]WJE80709.1 competence type IV pilus minor pilin ComGF [Bacillus sp. DX3.1]